MTHIEAMKQALDLLLTAQNNLAPSKHSAHVYGDGELWDKYADTITSLRQAIATEESSATQEPVMGVNVKRVATGGFVGQVWWISDSLKEGEHTLYTHPQPKAEQEPKREPLTDEQIEKLIFKSGGHKSTQNLMSNPMQVREYVELWNERIYAFARAIEAAHGIKGKA